MSKNTKITITDSFIIYYAVLKHFFGFFAKISI